MIRSVTALALVLLVSVACSPRSDTENVAQPSNTASASLLEKPVANDEPAPTSDSEKQTGMYRWSGGMQMGIMWAAVTNKRGDVFRFEDEPTDDGNVAWSVPNVELADEAQAKRAAQSDQINFVINGKAWVFGFESDGTTFTPTPMSGSGHSDAVELVHELETSKAKMICVEFPGADYRTCFSLAGAAEALGSAAE